jgi:hypothetical protein
MSHTEPQTDWLPIDSKGSVYIIGTESSHEQALLWYVCPRMKGKPHLWHKPTMALLLYGSAKKKQTHWCLAGDSKCPSDKINHGGEVTENTDGTVPKRSQNTIEEGKNSQKWWELDRQTWVLCWVGQSRYVAIGFYTNDESCSEQNNKNKMTVLTCCWDHGIKNNSFAGEGSLSLIFMYRIICRLRFIVLQRFFKPSCPRD